MKIIDIPNEDTSIQELKNSGMDDASIKKYFHSQVKDLLNEIKVMESLKSAKNIVSIEDYALEEHKDRVGWTIYIRMELLESLTSYMGKAGIKRHEVMQLGLDICDALRNCAQNQVIHRDIKIENIFRNQYGDFKLGDFGVAKQLEQTSRAATLAGTQTYMAPEVLRMEKYDRRVDIYSLGLVMYRLLNKGRFPFVPMNPMPDDIQKALERRLSGEALPAPCEAGPVLSAVVVKACAFRKEDRYSSAEEMRKELEHCQETGINGQEDIQNMEIASETAADSGSSYRWFDGESGSAKSDWRREEPDPPSNEPKRGKDILLDQYIDAELAQKGGKLQIEIDGRQYEAKVPANIKEGTILNIEGMGETGENGGSNGDLLIRIHIFVDPKTEELKRKRAEEEERKRNQIVALQAQKNKYGLWLGLSFMSALAGIPLWTMGVGVLLTFGFGIYAAYCLYGYVTCSGKLKEVEAAAGKS